MNELKKILIFLIVILLFSGCKNSNSQESLHYADNEFTTNCDLPMQYAGSNGVITRAESVYYARIGNWMFFYDNETGISGKVCGKAECAHNSVSCNAYIGAVLEGIQVYDGHLYWLDNGVTLCRADLDGNNREVIRNVKPNAGANPRAVVHRGYLYTSAVTSKVIDRQGYENFTLIQYGLQNTEKDGTVIFSKDYKNVASNYLCRFYRNNIYFIIDNDMNLDRSKFHRELYVYNIETKEVVLLLEEDSEWHTRDMIVDEQGIHLLELDSGNQSVRRAHIDIDSGQKDEFISIPMEAEYRGAGMVNDYIIIHSGYTPRYEELALYQVYNWEGELVTEGEIPGDDIYCIGWDENGIYLTQDYTLRKGNEITYYYKIFRIPYEFTDVEEFLIQYDEKRITSARS